MAARFFSRSASSGLTDVGFGGGAAGARLADDDSGTRSVSPIESWTPAFSPTRSNFLTVIFHLPVGVPARMNSPFLSVIVFSWRL